jgi:hypothetical protein
VRVRLDECVPRKLRRALPGHEVRTVGEMGWAGVKNGPLLARAAPEFDVFLTVDQNLPQQQRVPVPSLAIVVLGALSNDVDALRPLMPEVREALSRIEPGTVMVIRP